ncbi:MAG: hypothetical protein ABIE22_01480 [archaeon]
MKLKGVSVKEVLDSRKDSTVQVLVKTSSGTFSTSAPSGKSTGKFETPAYIGSVKKSINNLKLKTDEIKEIDFECFNDLEKLEAVITKKEIGANILFALEASVLKALAAREGKELWEWLNPRVGKFPMPVGNLIEGGAHSKGKGGKKPDFQEFAIIPRVRNFSDANFIMKHAYKVCGERLKLRVGRWGISDEHGWVTNLSNEETVEVLDETREEITSQLGYKIEIGLDAAASEFFTGFLYNYKNPSKRLKPAAQVEYISGLAEKYRIGYLEDALEEGAFNDFKVLRRKINRMRPCLIVGDDLTATQISRTEKAIKQGSINSMIVKVNQNGSLLEVKKIMDLCKRYEIATVFSHRSGETSDFTIADLAFAWKADFVKFGVAGREREAKLKRLIEIEKEL